MQIIQIDLHDRHMRKLFTELPFRIYRDTPQWVPPLQMDAERMLSAKKNAFFKNGEAGFFLALDASGMPLGRLAVLDNRAYNAFHHEQTAFFYLFECVDDGRVSSGLFVEGFGWARSCGLNKITGPKGFTVLDGLGMLVKGFEHRPAFGLPYNPPYYPRLVEAEGFITSGELVSGYIDTRNFHLPEKVGQVAERLQARWGMRVLRFKNRREFIRVIPMLQKLYNDSLEGTSGTIPLTEDDVKTMAAQFLWFADPRLIKIILKDDAPIGFLLAYPDLSAAVQRTRGRLFPLGWLDLLLEGKRTQWVNVNGAAIVEKYRGLGGTALLFAEMEDSIKHGGFAHADIVQIGVENDKMQNEMRSLGIEFYKTHRLYEKDLP